MNKKKKDDGPKAVLFYGVDLQGATSVSEIGNKFKDEEFRQKHKRVSMALHGNPYDLKPFVFIDKSLAVCSEGASLHIKNILRPVDWSEKIEDAIEDIGIDTPSEPRWNLVIAR